ncbi:MAG: hypothetical protein U0528_21520 [Anaerolineae bacterium]|nr:hypothetical protein [Anaerolineae bacterium]
MANMTLNVEICQIHVESRQAREGGILGINQKLVVYLRYVADVIDKNGVRVIAQTPEFKDVQGDVMAAGRERENEVRKQLEAARQQMTQQLINGGWTVMDKDQYGNVISLRREL